MFFTLLNILTVLGEGSLCPIQNDLGAFFHICSVFVSFRKSWHSLLRQSRHSLQVRR